MGWDEEAAGKEARYDGYVVARTSSSEENLPASLVVDFVRSRVEDLALYAAVPKLCPLCRKAASALAPSEQAALASASGYLADLALSIISQGASKKLGRKVTRTEAAGALRSMDATLVGGCASGIFERTDLTDAIEASSGIFLDSELITKPELERFLKISRGKA
jgi:hypothetical protein